MKRENVHSNDENELFWFIWDEIIEKVNLNFKNQEKQNWFIWRISEGASSNEIFFIILVLQRFNPIFFQYSMLNTNRKGRFQSKQNLNQWKIVLQSLKIMYK